MSAFKRIFGLDGVDLIIHAGITMFLMILGDQLTPNGEGVALVGVASFVALGVRRHFALKNLPPVTTAETSALRVAELEERLQDVEALGYRVQELEERVDFAERLLAQAREEPSRLEGPR